MFRKLKAGLKGKPNETGGATSAAGPSTPNASSARPSSANAPAPSGALQSSAGPASTSQRSTNAPMASQSSTTQPAGPPSYSAVGGHPGIGSGGAAGAPPPPPPPPPAYGGSWPQRYQVVDELYVNIHHYSVQTATGRTIWCWTYITDGLVQLKQTELAFTIVRRENVETEEDYPEFPVDWFQQLRTLAQNGQFTVDHGMTTLEVGEFLDRSDWAMFTYFSSSRYPNPFGPFEALKGKELLHIIPLVKAEFEVVQRYGFLRALTHLGVRESTFPFPIWVDRDRTPCITLADMEGTFRDKTAVSSIFGVSVIRQGDEVTLYVAPKAVQRVADAVNKLGGPNQVFGLDSYLYQYADSAMVWKKSFTQLVSYARGLSATCLNAGFIMFCPEQKENVLVPKEDGYVFLLTNKSWNEIRDGLRHGKSVSVPTSQSTRFLLTYSHPGSQGVPILGNYTTVHAAQPVAYQR